MNQLFKRLGGKTPKFFKNLRNIGLTLAAISGALLTAPIALPVAVTTFAGYLLTASGVIAAVSQLPVEDTTELND